MSSLFIYFILMLDGIEGFFVIAAAIGGTIAVVLGVFCSIRYFETGGKILETDAFIFKKFLTIVKYSAAVFISCIVLSVFVPNTKQAAAIWLIPKMANNEQIQEIPSKGLKLLEKKLDSYLDEEND